VLELSVSVDGCNVFSIAISYTFPICMHIPTFTTMYLTTIIVDRISKSIHEIPFTPTVSLSENDIYS